MKINELLKTKKNIVLGYLGGSITEGTGASEDRMTYRSIVTSWFKNSYPDNTFSEINAGIGGTGSDLGVFRVDDDLLKYHPDIVFIEFAVNDFGLNETLAIKSMEGIVRKVLKQNKNTLICFLYTLSIDMVTDFYSKGVMPSSILNHEKIAAHYHIPSINVGQRLYEHIANNQFQITDFLGDGVHPNDTGYQFYADIINKTLSELDFNITSTIPYNNVSFENAMLIPAKNIDAPNWVKTDESMQNRLNGYIYSNKAGNSFNVAFSGTVIGLYWTIEKDSGNIEYSIDGSEYKTASSWDKYALQFNRANYIILESSLENKSHVLSVRISNKKEEQSEGNYIRIGAVLCERKA